LVEQPGNLDVSKVRKQSEFERLPLIRGANDSYDGTLFDVTAPVDYFVEAVGVRSPVYSIMRVPLGMNCIA